jgi:hypothetical protein
MSLTKVTYSMIQDAMVNVIDYGADPTGVLDSTSQIESAINAGIADGKPVYIPYGTYKFNGYTNASTNAFELSIIGEEGNEPTLLCTQTAADAGIVMFNLPDNRYSNLTGFTLDADVFAGQSFFELTSTTGLQVGMVIQISTTRPWYNGSRFDPIAGTGKFCGEIHRIVGIDSGKVYIEDFTRDTYSPTALGYAIYIRAWNPSKVTIKNIIVETPYVASNRTSVGIQIQQTVDSVIENVKLKGFIQRCLSDRLTINSKYTNIIFDQDIDMPNSGVNGYGLATDGSVGLLLDGLKANGQRRCFDADCIDGSPAAPGVNGPARDWHVTNFHIDGGAAWLPSDLSASAFNFGLGTHGGSENGMISNGFINSCSTGINCRGRSTTINNVVFAGRMSICVALYEEAAGLTVKNCTYDSFGYPNKTADLDDLNSVTGCGRFISCGINNDAGICYYDIPIVIENNTVKGCRQFFIRLFRPATNLFVSNVYIRNNEVEFLAGTGNTAFFIEAAGTINAQSMVITNNKFKALSGIAEFKDADLLLGVRTASNPEVDVKNDEHFVVRIASDSVVKIPFITRTGNRIMVSCTARNAASWIMQLIPSSASFTNIANTPATAGTFDVKASADGSTLTGTTGSVGDVTFGLKDGDLWIENRRTDGVSGVETTLNVMVL